MAEIFVRAMKIDDIQSHPDADKLELAIVGGWQVIVGIGEYQPGDIAVHIPPDVVIPVELSDRWGVTKYLSKQRVRAVRLRGEMSYGFLVANEDDSPLGVDLKDRFGITKWEPPLEITSGDAEKDNTLFHKYTDIQNFRNFPDTFRDGEWVHVNEKIHGTNSRIGMVLVDGERQIMVGSHNQRKKLGSSTLYEMPLTTYHDEFMELFTNIFDKHTFCTHFVPDDVDVQSVIVFGEIYGKVQDLRYGLGDKIAYVAFDIAVNGRYIDYDCCMAALVDIPTAPLLGSLRYYQDGVMDLVSGNTTLMSENAHTREGIVIRPDTERTNPKIGRVVLKVKSPEYETRRDGTEKH